MNRAEADLMVSHTPRAEICFVPTVRSYDVDETCIDCKSTSINVQGTYHQLNSTCITVLESI